MNMENRYSHTDLYACSFMVAKGINILGTEKINDISSRFIMDCDKKTGDELYQRYRANETVGILDIKDSLRRVKDVLYNNKKDV